MGTLPSLVMWPGRCPQPCAAISQPNPGLDLEAGPVTIDATLDRGHKRLAATVLRGPMWRIPGNPQKVER
jgi:hypothetical protein